MLYTLKNTLLSGTALFLFTGCTSSDINRNSLDTTIREYHASVIAAAPVKLKSDIPEGARKQTRKSVSSRQLSRSRAGERSSLAPATQRAPCSSPENQR
jgi:hypothetical protein